MDTEEYNNYSMDESDSGEEEEEEDFFDLYDYYGHECKKKCMKCSEARSYEYVPIMKPVSFNEVPKLMEIASVRVAVSLWHHVNITQAVSRISRKCAKDSDRWEELYQKVYELPFKLPVPSVIRKMIENNIAKMKDEITTWVSYHFRTVFLKKGQDNVLYSLIYQIIWHPNGKIDCEQTARNMQKSLRLTEVEKFKFLCTYCLKDDIDKMSPLLFENVVLDFVNFSEYPLIYYWYCYYKNELHKIPVTENVSVDWFMFRLDKVDNWSAKQYFFERMSSEEQVQQAVRIIDKHNKIFQKHVLSKLNEVQRLQVCLQRPVKIMTYYARTEINSRELLSTWYEIRNLISQETFVRIFDELLKASTVDTILTDIWQSAPDNLKQYLLKHDNHSVFKTVLSPWRWSNDSEFIFALLQSADIKTKSCLSKMPFFNEFMEKLLANRNEFSTFNRLSHLCLPDIRELAIFKRKFADLPSVKNRCLSYYTSGNVNDANNLLNLLFSSESKPIVEYKKTLLMSTNDWPKPLFTDVWNSASDSYKRYLLNFQDHTIVDHVLNSTQWIDDDEFKFAMLECADDATKISITGTNYFFNYATKMLHDPDRHSGFERLLNLCFTENQETIFFKKHLANLDDIKNLCLNYYKSGDTKNVNNLLNLLLSSDTNAIAQYKKDLVMSPNATEMFACFLFSEVDILNVIVADALPNADLANEFTKQILFSPSALQRSWKVIYKRRLKVVQNSVDRYLNSNEDKTTFKEMLLASTNPETLMHDILKKYNASYCRTVMLWLYNDKKALRKFKQTLNVDKIFEDMLVASVFEEFHVKLQDCRFRSEISFEHLDRFLKWYFRSLRRIKQYKLEKIDSFRSIEMITTLMKKKGKSCLKTVMKWFFQNDAVEVSKFKAKHGPPIDRFI